jgi:hypothetical protein
MIELFDVFLLMLFASACAWLWRGHGIRERALLLTQQHCSKVDVELLDGNVALRRLALLPDARGRTRLARVYGFEFTVTGEQRHEGSITMFGQQLGRIELAPHPFRTPPPDSAPVIDLQRWRSSREHSDGRPPGD